MLHISWGQFWAITTILLIVYYTILIIFFYRTEVSRLFSKKSAQGKSIGERQEEEKVDGATIDVLEAVVADLRGILVKAGKEAGKRELLGQLSERLASYAGFRHPAFRVAIINYIVKNAHEVCGLSFSAEELEQQWQALPH